MNIGKHFLVVLKKTTELQGKKGAVTYKDASGNFDVDFKLGGTFEDESYGFFQAIGWKMVKTINFTRA